VHIPNGREGNLPSAYFFFFHLMRTNTRLLSPASVYLRGYTSWNPKTFVHISILYQLRPWPCTVHGGTVSIRTGHQQHHHYHYYQHVVPARSLVQVRVRSTVRTDSLAMFNVRTAVPVVRSCPGHDPSTRKRYRTSSPTQTEDTDGASLTHIARLIGRL
jgi:hypothetical protein